MRSHRGTALTLTRRDTLRLTAALGAGAMLGGAAVARPAVAQDATYPELTLVATEFAFEMPATTTSGYNRLTMDNQGGADHHAIFARLNDGVTQEQFMEVLMTGDLLALLDVCTAYGGPMANAGSQGTVIAWLDPGTYMVICVIPDEQGIPHVAHGMIAPLEVTEETSEAPDPTAAGTITLVEMAFEGLPAEVPAGSFIWEVTNGGDQLHEMVVIQLAPGVPAAAVLAEMMAPPPASPEAMPAEATPVAAGPPPFVATTGASPMSPGATNYLELTAVPGEYIVLCFVPDAETGMPHAMMGMVGSFVVV